jgi:hypothetical protein
MRRAELTVVRDAMRLTLVLMCLLGAGAAQGQGTKTPSLKRPEQPTLPAARLRKYYDSARNVTYVNVDITLDAPRAAGSATPSNKNANGTNASGAVTTGASVGRSVALVFQLIYKGATTTDLSAAYVFVQATAPPEQPARLMNVKRLDIDADGYLYGYDRTDYRTEKVAGNEGALVLQREAAVFQLSPDDLPQLANAGRLAVKFGAETFTVNSVQLAELRRTLVSGAD